jgi:hypothetical protein
MNLATIGLCPDNMVLVQAASREARFRLPLPKENLPRSPRPPRKMLTLPPSGSSSSAVCTFAASPETHICISVTPAAIQIRVPAGREITIADYPARFATVGIDPAIHIDHRTTDPDLDRGRRCHKLYDVVSGRRPASRIWNLLAARRYGRTCPSSSLCREGVAAIEPDHQECGHEQ